MKAEVPCSKHAKLKYQPTLQEAYCYRQLLQSVVNPLGAPDTRPGFRPNDLAEYVRQLFRIDKRDHELRVKEVQQSRPSSIVLSVSVVEAKDIKPIGSTGLTDSYCFLSVQKAKTPMVSPKNSPRASPRTSPVQARRALRHTQETESLPVMQTHTIRSTLYPKWNEDFDLDVHSVNTEELYLSIWDDSQRQDDWLTPVKEARHGIKGLFKHLTNHLDHCKNNSGLIGHCKIPIRNIPASGCDKWFDLYMDKKRKIKGQGQVRLKLQLSMKQDMDQVDSVESDLCSVEDYHYIVNKVYTDHIQGEDTIDEDAENNNFTCPPSGSPVTMDMSPDGKPVLLQLSEQGHAVLNQFAVQNHFSKITQKLMELVVVLNMFVKSGKMYSVSPRLVKDCINGLETEWSQHQGGALEEQIEGQGSLAHRVFTDTEKELFESAVSQLLSYMSTNLQTGSCQLPKLFPPFDIDLEQLKKKINLAVTLINLHMRIHNGDDKYQKDLSSFFVRKLQEDTQRWLDEQLSHVVSQVKDPVLPKTKLFVEVLEEAHKVGTPIYSVAQYFHRLGMDYFKIVSLHMEKRLSLEAKELMLHMDMYQVKYHRYSVNIRESSNISLQLYMALRAFYDMIRTNLTDRELFRVSMSSYQDWFQSAVTFWLQTFKEECIRRMTKALEIEKDVVQVTSLVKYSNSSVDILTCFQKITTEWRQIEFNDADIASLGATKITDTICDGVKLYMEKVMVILENNGYYDYDDNQQFDVTDQLCITMNNISHIRNYLHDLPGLLAWEEVTGNLAVKHEDEAVGRQALRTLYNLVGSAVEDVMVRGRTLMCRITNLIALDLQKYTCEFIKSVDCQQSSDNLLEYLQQNLQNFQMLEVDIYNLILREIWQRQIIIFASSLEKGKAPTYYKNMMYHLQSLRDYFIEGGVDPAVSDCEAYCELVSTLELNVLSSQDLMLRYYNDLISDVKTPSQYYGHLTVKIGYKEETDDANQNTISLHVKVSQARNLPGMKRNRLSDPYVMLRFCPRAQFRSTHSQKTEVQHDTTNPVFNHTFFFNNIPKDCKSTEGAVISFTVWHYDSILPNDFLGEAILSLADISHISANQSIEDKPAIMISLRRPKEPDSGPFQVLKERAENNEKEAVSLVERRRLNTGFTTLYKCCAPVRFFMTKVIGKRSEVVGVANGPMGISDSNS